MPSLSMYLQASISLFAFACIVLTIGLLGKGPRKKCTCSTCQHTFETEAALPKRYCSTCHSQYTVEVIRKTSAARIVGLVSFFLLLFFCIWIGYNQWEQYQEVVKHISPTHRS